MKNVLLLFISILVFSASTSCKKVEGTGGGATIKGIIQEQKYNALGNIIAEYPGSDLDVYLIYGTSDQFYDDDVKTSYDGSFVFKYLQKGTYTIFVYEDDATQPSGKNVVKQTFEITEKGQEVDLGTINTRKI
ncbi:MAG: hypothetical protein KA736_03375 [Crocinitomicaceae bacterium]|nr:hypothetical protein [Crocinitomicaceae bacterium]MBP6033636.1 hypothetical protein [Crocinitomicaceae bacterium]